MSTIRFLRTFLAVEKYGSFAAAADCVALTQAALGQQMPAIEEEFRRPLFYRSDRVIKLTQAAHALIPQARKFVAVTQGITAVHDQSPLAHIDKYLVRCRPIRQPIAHRVLTLIVTR
jgi:DNA-binding transcriptional LysR family regulator